MTLSQLVDIKVDDRSVATLLSYNSVYVCVCVHMHIIIIMQCEYVFHVVFYSTRPGFNRKCRVKMTDNVLRFVDDAYRDFPFMTRCLKHIICFYSKLQKKAAAIDLGFTASALLKHLQLSKKSKVSQRLIRYHSHIYYMYSF